MFFWWGGSYELRCDAMIMGGSKGQGMDYDANV